MSCKAFNPSIICIEYDHIKSSLNIPPSFLILCILVCKSPSSAYSITIFKDDSLSFQKASLYPITFGWFIDAKILTSLTLFSCSFLFSFSKITVFIAYIFLSFFLVTKYTEPNEPFPKTFSILKSDIDVEVI